MVSREDKFMIFSIWKTSLGFIIAFSLQLLFFSMMQLENKEENKKISQYKNVQLIFIQARDISDITESVTKRNVFNKKENIDTTLEKNSNLNKTQAVVYTNAVNLTMSKKEVDTLPEPREKPLIPLIFKIKEEVNIEKEILGSKDNTLVISNEPNIPIQNTYNLSARDLSKIDAPSSSPTQSIKTQNKRQNIKQNILTKSENLKQLLLSTNRDNKINITDINESENEYNTTIRAILNDNHLYPNRAIRQRKSGTTTLSFTLLSTGMVNDSSITSSSGHRILDRAAITMLKRSTPFPPFPTDINKSYLDFIIPVEFKLNNHSTYIKY